MVIVLIFFLIIEWMGREEKHVLEKIALKWNRPSRLGFYCFRDNDRNLFISNFKLR
jgi:hypothetical protein